ncbi:VOC family protein [Kineococcus sp. SYSU DK004]|uniref:VOC family protein n=1 Tax=Kineococcus sp. SYSU DK004 TaxID=3383125 RepID=UPI003D7D4388
MTLRFEVFPADLDRAVDFYTRVLGFDLLRDERGTSSPYVALRCGDVHVGAAQRPPVAAPDARRPPTGVELTLEVDDVEAQLARVRDSGWPVDEPLQERPWGLRDFRVLDPDGYYLCITSRR